LDGPMRGRGGERGGKKEPSREREDHDEMTGRAFEIQCVWSPFLSAL
jgi:hypothetical protein